jgi:hypothetical protein
MMQNSIHGAVFSCYNSFIYLFLFFLLYYMKTIINGLVGTFFFFFFGGVFIITFHYVNYGGC